MLQTRPGSGSPHLIFVHRPACSLLAFFSTRIAARALPFTIPFASIWLGLRLDHYGSVIIHGISLFSPWAGYPAHNREITDSHSLPTASRV